MTSSRTPFTALAAWRAELAASRRSPWLATLVLRHATAIARRAAAIHARLAALPRRTRRRLARQWAMALPVAALALAWSGGGAEAATIHVGGGCTLVDAIHAANGDEAVGGCAAGSGADTVVLGGGTYSYAEPAVAKDDWEHYPCVPSGDALPSVSSQIVIVGNGATIERAADALEEFRLLTVLATGDLEVEDATVRNGVAPNDSGYYDGGAVQSCGGLALIEVTIEGNSAEVGGALALRSARSRARVQDSVISGNVGREGSAIYLEGGASLELLRSVVRDNREAAAISAHRAGTIVLRDSDIIDNRGVLGGGVFIAGADHLGVYGGSISRNWGYTGGGLMSFGVEAVISDVTIEGNEASEGGALEIANETTMRIERSRIARNSGGAVRVLDADLTLVDSLLEENGDGWYGAGLFVAEGATAVVRRSTFRSNESKLNGGAIDCAGSLVLSDSRVEENTAAHAGGGIIGTGALTITGSVISGNVSETGGGVAGHGGLRLELRGSRVAENVAHQRGGGLSLESASHHEMARIAGSTISGNRAPEGAGVFVGARTHVERSEVTDNVASTSGGAFLVEGFGALTLTQSLLARNAADRFGGGLHARALATIVDSTIALNTAGSAGGGMFSDSTLRVYRSTIAANEAGWGGGVAGEGDLVILAWSILTGNGGGDCGGLADFLGTTNLIDDHANGACRQLGDERVRGLSQRLEDHGGPTLIYALQEGSNAIDAVSEACVTDHLSSGFTTDQRGAPRPQDGDGDGLAACDIGAYELGEIMRPIYLPAARRE